MGGIVLRDKGGRLRVVLIRKVDRGGSCAQIMAAHGRERRIFGSDRGRLGFNGVIAIS